MQILRTHAARRGPTNEARCRMATDAGGAGLSGGRSMERIVPFRALVFVVQTVMALRANTRAVADGDKIGITYYAILHRMQTAGAVTVFALDVGQVLQWRRHVGPVAVGQHARESPVVHLRHVVKAAVDGERVGIVAESVALNATLVVVAADQAINGAGEEPGMGRIRVSGENAGRIQDAATMAGSASIHAIISGRRDGGGDVRGGGGDGVRSAGTGRGYRGPDGVLRS